MKRIFYLILVVLFLTEIQSNNTVKVAFYFKEKALSEGTIRLCKKYHASLPIKLVNVPQADIVITDDLHYQVRGKPIILVSKTDPSTVPEKKLSLLERRWVKAFFARYCLRPASLNLSPTIHDCYHYSLVNKFMRAYKPRAPKKIAVDKLNKIKLVPWFFGSNAVRLNNLKSKEIDLDVNSRSFDVCFIGAIFHKGIARQLYPIYMWHRTQAVNALIKIRNLNNYIEIVNVTGPTKRFGDQKYMATLEKSKIVVSPWGWGEWSWRDYEAIYSGAVLIKPDTSFVETIPDIYQNNITYVPCKPDFSDLEEKVRYVLDQYDEFYPMRERTRQLLLDYTEKEFITHFANSVCRAYYSK